MTADGVNCLGAIGEETSPAGLGGLDPEAEEAEETFVEDHGRDGEGEVDDDDSGEIGEEMTDENLGMALAERAGGDDELKIFQAEDLAANDSGHGEPFDETEGENENDNFRVADESGVTVGVQPVFEAVIEGGSGEDDDNEPWDGVENFDEPHHQGIGGATDVTGNEAVGGADDEADGGTGEADEEGDAGPFHDAREEVSTVVIRAEEVGERWGRELVLRGGVRVGGKEQWAEESEGEDEGEERKGDEGDGIFSQSLASTWRLGGIHRERMREEVMRE